MLTNANSTGNREIRISLKSRKNKKRRTITLKPTINKIFINVEKRRFPILSEKKEGSNVFPEDLYLS